MNIKELLEKADELYNESILINEKNDSSELEEKLNLAIKYYEKSTYLAPFAAMLYYKIALAFKLNKNQFKYFLNVCISKNMGYKNAIELYNRNEFQKENSHFLKEKFVFVIEFVHSKNEIEEISYSMLNKKLYLLDSIDTKVNRVSLNKNNILMNDNAFNYESLFWFLFLRLTISSKIVTSDIALFQKVIDNFKNTELLNLFNIKEKYSIINLVNSHSNQNFTNITQAYNNLFPNNVSPEKGSNYKMHLTVESFREIEKNRL
ncbi:hypothetical protein [Gelatiniphilus marinus]|uniref:Uncharacterized protein n=1 Tax=Gelatiniphilus marinus TaxID=1759464 RepID=A0ABW5JYI9_9FLAO